MIEVDDAVLQLLAAAAAALDFDVYDGEVTDADASKKIIRAALPYVVLHSTPGYPINPRLGSRRGRAVEFMVNAVGEDRWQAKATGQAAEDALDGARIDVNGSGRKIHRTDDSPFIRRDDTWTRPGGGLLFVDSRRYSIAAR